MSAPAPTRLALIAAVAVNGVIGRRGQLPWHLPDDLKRFKELTYGHAIIMGRRTYESLGRPLPGRSNVVLSRTPVAAEGVVTAASLQEALRVAADSPSPAFIIGGGVLYAAALPLVQTMHLTELDEAVEGDAYFPPYDKSQWKRVSEVRHERDARHGIGFRFCTYERV